MEAMIPPLAGLGACGIEDPTADLDDLAAILENGNEIIRGDHAPGRMSPPDQSFDATDIRAVEIDDRLIEKEELFVGQRGFDIRSEFQPSGEGFLHRRFEHHGPVTPRRLAPVERNVRVTKELLGGCALSHGHADARRDTHLDPVEAFDGEWLLENLTDSVGERVGSLGERQALGEDDELVTAETTYRVTRSQDRLEPPADGLQQLVAGFVAERVVGVLEVVEVDEERSDRIERPPRPGDHLLGPVEDELPIGQTGEGVVQGPVGE